MDQAGFKKRLEMATNVAVLLAALIVIATFAKNFFAPRPKVQLESGFKKGFTLPQLPGLHYSNSHETLILGKNILDESSSSTDNRDYRSLPEYWGAWFVPIDGSDMKETDLQLFYQMGKALADIRRVGVGDSAMETLSALFYPEKWLNAFLEQTNYFKALEGDVIPVPDSQTAAEKLLKRIRAISKRVHADSSQKVFATIDDVGLLNAELREFEKTFEHECKNINVLTVTNKGTHWPRELMNHAELNLPADARARLDKSSLVDLRSAGRCLAFETPTAAAFHVLRSVEPMIIKYMNLITARAAKKSKSRDWGTYIRLLRDHDGDSKVVAALQHIKDFYRNPIMHPEETLTADQALSLFHTCLSVLVQLDAAIQGWKGKA